MTDLNKKNNFFKGRRIFFRTSEKKLNPGVEAENLAQKFLEKNNLQCIHKNYYTRLGEIDRIMLDDNLLIFVEVRLRSNRQVSALESVDKFKQRKIIKAAQYFLLENKQYQNFPCRFDVIALKQLSLDKIIWVKDAFQI